jgi:hypothetical protein
MQRTLAYSGAFISIVWGIAHLVPTRAVVKGFGATIVATLLLVASWTG